MLAEIDDQRPTAWEMHGDAVRIFFVSADARQGAASHLTSLDAGLTCTPVDVSDEAWAERSQISLGPVQAGRIVVTPPWRRDDAARMVTPAGDPPVVLLIQPSMGFGTGHHATTRLCLNLMQRRRLAGARVLDVGTGSGVLALAARQLGAHEVEAIDHDADALHSAAENLALNGAGDVVRLRLVGLDAGANALAALGRFDLVVANLTGAALQRFAAALVARVAPPGALIVSGFEADEEPGVRQSFEPAFGVFGDRLEEAGWVALALTIPTPSTAR